MNEAETHGLEMTDSDHAPEAGTDRGRRASDDEHRSDGDRQDGGTSRRRALQLAGLAAAGGSALVGAAATTHAGGDEDEHEEDGDASDGDGDENGDGEDDLDGRTQTQRLTAPDGESGDRFGQSIDVAADCPRVIVGAAGEEREEVDGAAYVFALDDEEEWRHTATLTGDEGGRFGAGVALDASGQTALVGAPETETDTIDTGAAYVFARGCEGWERVARFAADEVNQQTEGGPALGNIGEFGAAAALDADGETALVGAPGSSRPGSGSGTTLLFSVEDGTWTQTAEVPWGVEDGAQGTAVDLDAAGDRGVSGAPHDLPSFTGVVTVFDTDVDGDAEIDLTAVGGGEETGLTTNDESLTNHFGYDVATTADGELVLGGAPATPGFDDDPGSGAAHAFALDDGEWEQVATLVPDGAENGDRVGEAVDFDADGETSLVGAPERDTAAGEDAGAAFTFANGCDWEQEETLVADDGAAGAEFGSAAELNESGDTGFVGAPGQDTDDGDAAGAVYVYDLEE